VPSPCLAFPLRFVGTTFASVEPDEPAHVQQCAEIIIRTPQGAFEHDPELGMPDVVGLEDRVSPIVAGVLAEYEPRREWTLEEDAPTSTVRDLLVSIAGEEG
jgi:phage baseplate assembly protein W